MIEESRWRDRIFGVLNYVFLTLFALFCLFPFWLMIVASFTDDAVLRMQGYLPWASKWSLDAYRWVLAGQGVRIGYRVTVFVTVVGTLLSLVIMSGLAYVMSLRSFKGRNALAFYVFFAMIFIPGIIPWFLTVRMVGLYDNIWALIVPPLVQAFWVFVMRNFFASLPEEILESARIDGASDATILTRIVLPLSLPVMATVALFIGVMYWNDYFLGVMLLDFSPSRPLSVVILRMMTSLQSLQEAMRQPGVVISLNTLPSYSARMATAAITIGPIILAYPFVQRYFIRGLTIGAVKG
ncbi:MAG: carbohydrate ABC transporter permease [Chloroflexi bacterium]|nr:carbohydrate ABC transporter permease [Chloroflexota bacterium]